MNSVYENRTKLYQFAMKTFPNGVKFPMNFLNEVSGIAKTFGENQPELNALPSGEISMKYSKGNDYIEMFISQNKTMRINKQINDVLEEGSEEKLDANKLVASGKEFLTL